MCRDEHQRVIYAASESDDPSSEDCPVCVLRAEVARLREALINLRAKCIEMGWGPKAPQLLAARAALAGEVK